MPIFRFCLLSWSLILGLRIDQESRKDDLSARNEIQEEAQVQAKFVNLREQKREVQKSILDWQQAVVQPPVKSRSSNNFS